MGYSALQMEADTAEGYSSGQAMRDLEQNGGTAAGH